MFAPHLTASARSDLIWTRRRQTSGVSMVTLYFLTPILRILVPIVTSILLVVGLNGCATLEERRRVSLAQDIDTCASFGAAYGSPDYTGCMLTQQQRRDAQGVEALERARLATEINKTMQDMTDSRIRNCERQRKHDRPGARRRTCA
ncbi:MULTISPECIES: hypothetical protein [unclassified Sphingomonas]|uniref:hypothetical protein n=1 Tax=unclassified Sphingomonas TaxID=196159 RepID=UPI001602876A|nr:MULTISPECIES: hypothetical protein [unclassified Sphingomonas]